jgi:hypothetical protein
LRAALVWGILRGNEPLQAQRAQRGKREVEGRFEGG